MKSKRQAKIKELIRAHQIETQEELQLLLAQEGFDVTQATISRDIRELQLVKIASADGKYYYAHNRSMDLDAASRSYSLFADSVNSIQSAQNLIVIKCITGAAQAACAALDSMDLNGLLGTLAGDDTIFAVAQTNKDAEALVDVLQAALSKK